MKIKILAACVGLSLILAAVPVVRAAVEDEGSALSQIDLSQYVYSYGTVLNVTETQITLQEYDYDSDVEKEVVYQILPITKLEGFKAVAELAVEDVVEVYYNEENGQRVAKIIHRESIDDESVIPGAEL